MNSTFNSPGTSRGEGVKYLAFAEEVWQEAQQTASHLSAYATHVSITGGLKFFDGVKKRDMKAALYGNQKTPDNAQETTRIALTTKPFEDGIMVDKGDQIDNTVDLLSASRTQMKHALARLTDAILLSAIISPVQVGKKGVTDGTTHRVTADLGTELKYKDFITYAKNQKQIAANAVALDAFTGV